MGIGSGLGSSFGMVPEVTYGTYAAPTRWLEATSKLQKRKGTYQGGGMAAGRYVRPGARRYVTGKGAAGTLAMPVYSKGMGYLLNGLLGGTVTPVQQGATAAYLQTHAIGDPLGKFYTMQAGIPRMSGTVDPYTFLGCQIMSLEFRCEVGGALMMTVEVEARDVTDAQTLAAPSYSVVNEFHWAQGAFKLGTFGAEATVDGVKSVSVKISRPRHAGGPYMGNAGLRSQGVVNDWAAITGSAQVDYSTKTDFADRYANDTSTSLLLEFVGPNIASTFFETFRIKVPMIFFDGDTPTADGPDVVSTSFPFVGDYDLTNPPVTIETISTDTTL